jgi:hypothetical protein
MKSIAKKLVLLSVFGISSMAFNAFADAGPHGAVADPCLPEHPNTANQWDCVEWTTTPGGSTWMHATEAEWFGPDGTDSTTFSFSGDNVVLTCGTAEVSCTLTLEGHARINTEVGNDFSIRVVDGDVEGGFLCGFVDLNFDPYWYFDVNNHSGPWTDNSYVANQGTLAPYTGSTVASVGNIDLAVSLLGISVTDGHIDDVVFENGGAGNPSSFTFNGSIDESDGTPTGCTISGGVVSYDDINAW